MFTIKGCKVVNGMPVNTIAKYDDKKRLIRKIECKPNTTNKLLNSVVTDESLIDACCISVYGCLRSVITKIESDSMNTYPYFRGLMNDVLAKSGDGFDLVMNAYVTVKEKYFESNTTLASNGEVGFYNLRFGDTVSWSIDYMKQSNYVFTPYHEDKETTFMELVNYACNNEVREVRKPTTTQCTYVNLWDEEETLQAIPKKLRKALHYDDSTKEYDLYEMDNLIDILDTMPKETIDFIKLYLESDTVSDAIKKSGMSRKGFYKKLDRIKKALSETIGKEYRLRREQKAKDDILESDLLAYKLKYEMIHNPYNLPVIPSGVKYAKQTYQHVLYESVKFTNSDIIDINCKIDKFLREYACMDIGIYKAQYYSDYNLISIIE